MWWPFNREKREGSYTDTLVQQILSSATGASLALPTTTGALESCSGLVARAFAAAEVQGPPWAQRALTPACLALIGRALIRQGEVVFAIDGDADGLRLWPAADHDVSGGFSPASWLYRLNLAGPSYMATREDVAAAGVIHCMYMQDPAQPWAGIGPIQSAQLAGRLSAETMKALSDEAASPRGSLLPVPNKDGEDDTVANLKADIRKLNGNVALVESQATMQPDRPAGEAGWQSRRLGFNAPSSLVELASQASREIMAACGVSPALFDATAAAASREAYRQLLHNTIAPLGKIVASEVSAKLEADIRFDWIELRAGDIVGRARAFQSMVGAGMDTSKPTGLAGLMSPE